MSTVTVDWSECRKAAEKGVSYSVLAARFGVSVAAVAKRSQREGWRGQQSIKRLTKTVMASPEVVEKTKTALADKAASKMAEGIGQLMSKVVSQASQIMDRSHEMAMSAVSARDLKDATIAYGISHQHTRLALGLDRPDGLRSGQPWAQANVIDIQTVKPSAPPTDVKPIDV